MKSSCSKLLWMCALAIAVALALALALALVLAVVFINQVTLAVLSDLPLRPKTSGHAASTQNFGWL
jgi:hypothetical protein